MEVFQSENQQVMILRNPSQRRDFLFLACSFLFFLFQAPVLSQGVTGYVREDITSRPVSNAIVSIVRGDSTIAALSVDSSGKFEYLSGNAMRITLMITGIGYKPFVSEELILDGYSTYRMESYLQRTAYELAEVTVVESSATQRPYSYRITKDDLNTIAGNFDDPVRIAVSEPGIVQINDQANHISVRGQNPLFNSWYLEGLEIVNPSHTNNAGTFSDYPTQSGGGVNMFSAQALGSTDVYTGINPLSIGRSAGAVIDMHLHESEKAENRAKAGLIGLEYGISAAKGEKDVLDINLRYSFTGLLANLGVDFGGEKISFGDAVVSFRHQGARHKLKIYVWGGGSENIFDKPERPEIKEKYKDFFDIDFLNYMGGIGLRYDQSLGSKSSLKTGVSISRSWTNYKRNGQFGDNPVTINFLDEISIVASMAEFNYAFSNAMIFSAGANYTYKRFADDFTLISLLDEESFLRPYLNASIDISRSFTFEIGGELNYAFSDVSDAASIYPGYRAQLQWQFNEENSLFAGARHSAGQNVKTFGPEEPYRLPLLIDKYELGWSLAGRMNLLQLKAYFNEIKNLPVYFVPNGFIHVADAMDPVTTLYFAGSNEGKSRYYGIEGKWEYQNNKGWKLAANQTIYESKRSIDEDEFTDGRFSGGYASHISVAKEIIRFRKEKNRIWNFSLRGILQGGLWEPTIDVNNSMEFESTVYTNPGVFTEQLESYKRVDASISRTIANPKIRWRYALDIQNLFGFSNIAYHYYDPFLGRVESQEHLGIIPVFSIQASW